MGIITLLTDFGTTDHFVAAMKGVILCASPGTTIVDITHDVPPFDLLAGSRLLESAWPWFPPETVNLAVVDPGVGTSRKVLVARHRNRWFVAPDNGILGFLDPEETEYHSLIRVDFFTPEPCPTFHGRDVFAPLAAFLSRGGDPALACVREQSGRVVRLKTDPPVFRDGRAIGRGVHCDRFGNIVTNLSGELLKNGRVGDSSSSPGGNAILVEVLVSGRKLEVRGAICFGDAPAGETLALAGSTGKIEICVSGGSAAELLGPPENLEVRVALPGAGGHGSA